MSDTASEEKQVSDRIEKVCADLTKGRVGTSDRSDLARALDRATRDFGVGRALGPASRWSPPT